MHDPTSVLENQTHKLLWSFDIQTDLLVSPRRPELIIIPKTKRTCRILDFTVSADHRVKLKGNEKKKDKYLDLGTFPIGMVKGLKDLEIRGQVEIIQTIALIRSARRLRKVQLTREDLLSLKLK